MRLQFPKSVKEIMDKDELVIYWAPFTDPDRQTMINIFWEKKIN